MLQTAHGVLASSPTVTKHVNRIVAESAGASGGTAQIFKALRRGGRQALLSLRGLAVFAEQATSSLATAMDHTAETGERDYSLASAAATQEQETAHAKMQVVRLSCYSFVCLTSSKSYLAPVRPTHSLPLSLFAGMVCKSCQAGDCVARLFGPRHSSAREAGAVGRSSQIWQRPA